MNVFGVSMSSNPLYLKPEDRMRGEREKLQDRVQLLRGIHAITQQRILFSFSNDQPNTPGQTQGILKSCHRSHKGQISHSTKVLFWVMFCILIVAKSGGNTT